MPRRLYGSQELQERLGVSRTRVRQLTALPSFPAPIDVIAAGKVWDAAEVERWIREHRPDLADSSDGE
jgi:predicted DNA-binding transcriptional regulator AlpA